MDGFTLALIDVAAMAAFGALAYAFWILPNLHRARRAAEEAQKEIETRVKEARLQAMEEALKARAQMEEEIRERQRALSRQEEKLAAKEEALEERRARLHQREQELDASRARLAAAEARVEALRAEVERELERIGRISKDEARALVIQRAEEEAREAAQRRAKIVESQTLASLNQKVREMLLDAMQRAAVDVVSEATITVIQLPSEDMKGRIIGREGRNIRAFEQLAGVDLIIDDTPQTVVVSCFDPVRREIASRALTMLIDDGRIHPPRIEELYEKARLEVEKEMEEAAQRALELSGVGSLPPTLFELLGRLRYRTSYGQNVLNHSIEVARFAGIMAAELGLDEGVARRAGLLHDIGKALGPESEGSHALAGMELLRKLGEREEVVQAVGAHHGDLESPTAEAALVSLADSVSASRPGARRESLEQYIRRLSALEQLAASFPGVERAYAVQAGREVRLLVKPDEVDDRGAARLAEEVVKRIEQEAEYPGSIRVTVIRESRFTQMAK